MPRLTNQQYLDRRQVVLHEWYDEDGGSLGFLHVAEQHAIHRYFATLENFTPTQALEFRDKISVDHPALPQIAGRAYKNLDAAIHFVLPEPAVTVPGTRKQRNIRVSMVAKAEPDYYRLARLLLRIATDPELKNLKAYMDSMIKR